MVDTVGFSVVGFCEGDVLFTFTTSFFFWYALLKLVKKYVRSFGEGPVFQRRYSEQAIPLESDLEDRFFYCALQPVQAGLCKKISELALDLLTNWHV